MEACLYIFFNNKIFILWIYNVIFVHHYEYEIINMNTFDFKLIILRKNGLWKIDATNDSTTYWTSFMKH